MEERCLGKLKALSCGFDTRYAIDESGVCEGRPIGQREMRQMAQCLRDLGFVQDRNATRGPGLSRTRKWRRPSPIKAWVVSDLALSTVVLAIVLIFL